MKNSFDGINWYQLEWLDIGFKEFEKVANQCNDINELITETLKAFPNCQLKYKYLKNYKKITRK